MTGDALAVFPQNAAPAYEVVPSRDIARAIADMTDHAREWSVRSRRSPDDAPYLIPAGRLHASLSARESWSMSLVATELAGNVPSTVVAPRSLGAATANRRGEARDLPVLWSLLDRAASA
ncbi:hypothetical protein AB0392_25690 [Nonomuraea angiospora]|uniref:hypothetical protein n=1 Tax=Nonomuraea angiospora TaxID=46172 RepID=UPI00344BDC72